MRRRWPTRREALNACGLLGVLLLAGAALFFLWRRTPTTDRTFEFTVALAVLGTLAFAALGALTAPWRSFVDRFTWRDVEYRKLSQLHAGISIREFERVLGNPFLEKTGKDGTLHEFVFRSRDYWVQAIYDATRTVKFFAVTSVSKDFKPTFSTPLGSVTLQVSSFDALHEPRRIRYFTRGATAPSYYFDEYGSGNPTYYRTYTFGANEVGPFISSYLANLKTASPFMSSAYTCAVFSNSDANVKEFREASVINTYGETDEWCDIDTIIRDFCVGPDPIRVRAMR